MRIQTLCISKTKLTKWRGGNNLQGLKPKQGMKTSQKEKAKLSHYQKHETKKNKTKQRERGESLKDVT